MTKKIVSFILTLAMLLTMFTLPASAATLKTGSKGNAVRYLQMQLNFLDYNAGKEDGIYGKTTREAVLAYQKDNGLARDGIAGNVTNNSLYSDVRELQQALSALGFPVGSIDGIPGSNTKKALQNFEKSYGLYADGIADEWTRSLLMSDYQGYRDELYGSLSDFEEMALNNWTLPLKDKFGEVYGSRVFGASRENGARSHAGIDFVAGAGTPVYAMTSGTVALVYPFLNNSYAVEVNNDDGSVLLYGEITPVVQKGQWVEQGQLLGYIVTVNKLNTTMLHLELYRGTGSGMLTQRSNKSYDYLSGSSLKYGRRSDLLDPTFLLNCAKAS